ncbi:hypothetical protein [Geomonas subterranea]|uniref:Uncharacterized protein n=1 Tax=Geomonas subterranea TaxID=2847989 RepID=A0ABX8LJ19_9BACT|nr:MULTISPECIES: hypothetical protein [Geomonas]QXE92030.1 hypothetical protein KP001_05720 [Geomonas subterranea]QXM09877.1 hypothetical protein KP002_01775 [Geomonas subterranea]
MTDMLQKLQSAISEDPDGAELLREALQEIRELRKQRDALEEILIVLSRTELPWDEHGNPTGGLPHFRERYLNAVHEAADLLGLELRSTITRTEPRT